MFFIAEALDREGYGLKLNYRDGNYLTIEGKEQGASISEKVKIRTDSFTISTVTQLILAANYCITQGIDAHMDYFVEIVSDDIIGGYLGLIVDEDAYQALNIDPARRVKNDFEIMLLAPPCIDGKYNGTYVGKKMTLHITKFAPFSSESNQDEDL